ncbi:MAG TPA: hypothetical protein VJU15_14025 [Gemmatimonadales bacterium]|nr:hypothetical protein [Gemmatimonadales bacterium]
MKYPFHRRFTIESNLPLAQATSRLGESIGPVRRSLFERTREPFTGKLRGESFDIMRTTYGRNSVRAHIRGQIEPVADGTMLHGVMKIHELVIGFFALIVLGPGMFLGGVWLTGLLRGRLDPFLVIFPAVAIGLLALFATAFNHESRRALRMLADIVEAERSGFE